MSSSPSSRNPSSVGVIWSCIEADPTSSICGPGSGVPAFEDSIPDATEEEEPPMALTVESTSMADGEAIAGDVRGRHTDGRRQGRDGGSRPEPASAMVGRAGGHEVLRDLRRRPRRAGRSEPDGRRGAVRSATTSRASSSRTGSSWTSRPRVHELPEGAGGDGFVAHGKPPEPPAPGGVTGQNGYRGLFEGNPDLEGTYGGWDGPFPPWNDEHVHHYLTTVYALDVDSLGLGSGLHARGVPRRDRRAHASTRGRSCRPTR